MLVVKKPFKNYGVVYTVGTVIAVPTNIKRLKGKIAEGKIIVVTEHNYEYVAKYFKDKYDVAIPAISDEQKSEEQTPDEQKSEEQKSEEQKSEEQTPDEQKSEKQVPEETKPEEQKPVTVKVSAVSK